MSMKKFRISMIVFLLVGVLLAGIGTGAAFTELSDVQYNGTVWLGAEEQEERKLVYEIQGSSTDHIYCYTGMNMRDGAEVIENRKVPLNEVWFEVVYNPVYGEPIIEYYGTYDVGEYQREEMHIWVNGSGYNEFEAFMEIKDQILEDLKQNKISSYLLNPVMSIKAHVHPMNMEKFHMM